jgi:sporulation protein YlmC with PRC-barrel domain
VRARPGRRPGARPADVAHLEPLALTWLVGTPVVRSSGARVGTLADVVVRWDAGDEHPPVVGTLVHERRGSPAVPVAGVLGLGPNRIYVEGIDPQQGEETGLVRLAGQVLDRLLVDADGTDLARVSDLVLALLPDGLRLIGVDVSARTFLRRLGPRRLRRRVTASRIVDWATVAGFSLRAPGEPGAAIRITPGLSRLDGILDDVARDGGVPSARTSQARA